MKYVFAALMVLLCAPFADGKGVLKMTEKSDIIVVGTVELKNSYYTTDVSNGVILTDVLVRINQLIKGQPNTGKNHVKFAIEGGTAYVPSKDEVLSTTVFPQATFDIGENVLLFLRAGKADGYRKGWPHGRLYVLYWREGKKTVALQLSVA